MDGLGEKAAEGSSGGGTPGEADLLAIRRLYYDGQYLEAYKACDGHAPLHHWQGVDAALLAGRLLMNLGAARLGMATHLRAFRRAPSHPEAIYYGSRAMANHRGALETLELVEQFGELEGASASVQADWFAFRAQLLGIMRDFDAAGEYLRRAEEIEGDRPWICVERSSILGYEDRYEEALAAARRSLELRPWFRPGVQATAHALDLLGRDEESSSILEEAAQRLQSNMVVAQLAAAQMERGLHREACVSYERVQELSPLAEPDFTRWLCAMRGDSAYLCGDLKEAARQARLVQESNRRRRSKPEEDFYCRLEARLSGATAPGRRIHLPVGFVRQHYMTCAPATLTAISRFWNRPAEHLEVAERICYDGTSGHSERQWAEDNGWATREFTISWEGAVALLERGLPFTMATSEPGGAHLQAVVGYDDLRRTMLIRDPFVPYVVEMEAQQMLERYRSTGPRGHVLVPRERSSGLDALGLQDAGLFDLYHRLMRALEEHDRETADAQRGQMRHTAPSHRLTRFGALSLAAYDTNDIEKIRVLDELLADFPDDTHFQLMKLSCLREISARDARLALLKEMVAKPKAHPISLQQLAQELADDAREHERAEKLIRRAIRSGPDLAGSLYILGNIRWQQRRFEDSLKLYRYATCLGDKIERFANAYSLAAWHLGQTARSLALLECRFARFGGKSSGPVRTLFEALDRVERTSDAFAALEEGLRRRPDDGDLMLFAASQHGRYGRLDRASALLATAQSQAPRAAWLRCAAFIASLAGDRATTLSLWRQVLELDPLDMDAHASVAESLDVLEGRAAGDGHLSQAAARFPHHTRLHQLRVSRLREQDECAAETALRHSISGNPSDAWSHRELAIILAKRLRLDEAMAALETAARLDPNSPSLFAVRGDLLMQARRFAEAREAFRRSITFSARNVWTIEHLLGSCDTANEQREALEFILNQVLEQGAAGDGIIPWAQLADRHLAPDAVLDHLLRAKERRPDVWQIWLALADYYTGRDRMDEAQSAAQEATKRFPLIPRLWACMASIERLRGNDQAEQYALQQALAINRDLAPVILQLAGAYQRCGRVEDARDLLERACQRQSQIGALHGAIASLLWSAGDRAQALERICRAIELEPQESWLWDRLVEWSAELSQPNAAVDIARDLVRRRPGDVDLWLTLARVLRGRATINERFEAIDRALALAPRSIPAHVLRAELLAETGRDQEAVEACRPPAWPIEARPPQLCACEAEILSTRGRLREATDLMQRVVKAEPNYFAGWLNLANWFESLGELDSSQRAAEELHRLAPQNPVSIGMLASRLLASGHRQAAKEHLRKAVARVPQYNYAVTTLLQLELEDKRFDSAAEIIEIVRRQLGEPAALPLGVQLATARSQPKIACTHLARLARVPTKDSAPLEWAITTMVQAGWREQTSSTIIEAARSIDVNPAVGELWMDWCVAGIRFHRIQKQARQWLDRGEFTSRALAGLAHQYGIGRRRSDLQALLSRHRRELSADLHCWSRTATALNDAGMTKAAIRWISDWKTRGTFEQWMMVPIVNILHSAGSHAQANEIALSAERLEPDNSALIFNIWISIEAAITDQLELARRRLAQIAGDAPAPLYALLLDLARLTVEADERRSRGEREWFSVARFQLAKAVRNKRWFRNRPEAQRMYRRCATSIARRRKGVAARTWLMWVMFNSSRTANA